MARMAPLRVLFLNEGELGPGVMGHAPVEAAIRAGLEGSDAVEPRFHSLGALGLGARTLVREVPLLGAADLDLQPVRWHTVQALRARRIVRRELAAGSVDVLHVNSHSIALGLLDEMRSVPTFLSVDTTIWDWHALDVWRTSRPWSRLTLAPSLAAERRALGRAACVLAWTRWARDGALSACPAANVVEHNAGVDLELFRPAPRESRALPRVLFVGGRFAEKGGFDLLEALQPLLGGAVELDLVTPADVPELDGVRVHRLGPRDRDLVRLYQQADVVCLPTHADSMGWVLIEAMACGAAVVGTRVGGIPDVLDEGRAGVLVEPRRPQALRTALERLLGNGTERRRLGEAARARCEQRYDARRQADELVGLMQQAVAARDER